MPQINVSYDFVDRYGRRQDSENTDRTFAQSHEVLLHFASSEKCLPILVTDKDDLDQLPQSLEDWTQIPEFLFLDDELMKRCEYANDNNVLVGAASLEAKPGQIKQHHVIHDGDVIEYMVEKHLGYLKTLTILGLETRDNPFYLSALIEARKTAWFDAIQTRPQDVINSATKPARMWNNLQVLVDLYDLDIDCGECPDAAFDAHDLNYGTFVGKIKEKVIKAIQAAGGVIRLTYDAVKKIFTSIYQYGQVFFEYVENRFHQVCDNFMKTTFENIMKTFRLAMLDTPVAAACITVFLLTAACGMGFILGTTIAKMVAITASSLKSFVKKTIRKNTTDNLDDSFYERCEDDDFYECFGNDAIDGSAGVAALLLSKSIATLSGSRETEFAKSLKLYTTIFASGAIAFKAIRGLSEMLWMLMPVAIKTYLSQRFATKAQRQLEAFMEWRDVALTCVSTRIPEVHCSAVYKNAVLECLQQALQGKIIPPDDQKMVFNGLMQKLADKQSQLERYAQLSGTRQLPFAMHISGAAGVGKSTHAPRIIKDAFGYKKEQTYTKSKEPFWSGYISQPVVLWDEYLSIRNEDDVVQESKEFLSLVSRGDFAPEFADIKPNLLTGQKGTKVHPKLVVTMNNVPHDNPLKVDRTAFQRRRNVVVNITVKPGTPMIDNGANIDVSKLSEEERVNLTYLEFQAYPGDYNSVLYKGGYNAFPMMNYFQLVEHLKELHEQHLERCQLYDEASSSVNPIKPISADQIFMGCLARIKGIPTNMNQLAQDAISGVASASQEEIQTDNVDERSGVQSPRPSDVKYEAATTTTMKDIEEFKEQMDEAQGEEKMIVYENAISKIPHEVMAFFPSLSVHAQEYFDILYNHIEAKNNFIRGAALGITGISPKIARIAIGASIGWLAVLGATYIFRFIRDSFKSNDVMESMSMNPRREARKRPSRNRQIVRSFDLFESHNGFGNSGGIGTKDCLSFMFECEAKDGSADVRLGYGIPLFSHYFLTNLHHFVRTGDDGIEWFANGGECFGQIKIRGQIVPVRVSKLRQKFNVASDTIIIEVDNKTPSFPNNMNKFISEDSITDVKMQHGEIVIPDEIVHHGRFSLVTKDKHAIEYSVPWGSVKPDLAYKIDVPSKKGHCGSPLKATYGLFSGKIVGMLCAGQTEKGPTGSTLCTLITSDEINELLSEDDGFPYECCAFPNQEKSQYLNYGTLASAAVASIASSGALFNGLDVCRDSLDQSPEDINEDVDIFAHLRGPNVLDINIVPYEERVHLNRKTAIQRSALADFLPSEFQSKKKPAILEPQPDKKDPTIKIDPVEVKIQTMAEVEFEPVDRMTLAKVSQDVMERYTSVIKNFHDMPMEKLTIEEACGGIPGVMRGMTTGTSAGFPLCKNSVTKGKKPWMYHEDGEIVVTDKLRQFVTELEDDIINGREVTEHRWQGHLKDETVSQEKIDNLRTRVIYCGDMIRQIIYRMWLGPILAAINNSPLKGIPSCISLNQYSFDMDKIYNYLVGHEVEDKRHTLKFQAGDYKNFDMRHTPEFTEFAYNIIRDISPIPIPDNIWNDFLHSESQSPVAFDKLMVRFKSFHPSGCLFTTPKNNIQNELYFRYIYAKLHPERNFDEDIRMVVLGDDHILCMKQDVDFPGPVIASEMEKIGQIYTSDKKGAEIEDYQKWEDIHFLGAQPKQIHGKWVGAPKLATISDMLTFTSDRDQTLIDKCEQALDLASLWDFSSYRELHGAIARAIQELTSAEISNTPWNQRRFRASNRTAGKDDAWYSIGGTSRTFSAKEMQQMIAAGATRKDLFTEIKKRVEKSANTTFTEIARQARQRQLATEQQNCAYEAHSKPSVRNEVRDLTTFHTEVQDRVVQPRFATREDRALGEEAMSIEYTLDSHIFRTSFDWSTNDAAGTILQTFAAPFEILTLGPQSNIQNMAFERFIYWHGDAALMLQINGTPFLQGALVLFWYPLGTLPSTYEREQWLMLPHVMLNPHTASSAELRVPFQYPRAALNTFAGIDQNQIDENLGTFAVGVLSPLVGTAPDSVTITMYSSFPDSKLTIPRPVNTNQTNFNVDRDIHAKVLPVRRMEISREFPAIEKIEETEEPVEWAAHGQGGSTMTTNNTYNIQDVVGNVPVENNTTPSGNEQTISPDTDVALMDNPICASGAVPLVGQFPGASRSNGLVPSQNLALHPQRYERLHQSMSDPKDMNIHHILAKPAYFGEFDWSTTDTAGTVLKQYNLNSTLGKNTGDIIPANIAFLNLCKFVRYDVVFHLYAVKTNFQTGRLRASIAYGAPSLQSADVSVYYNQTLDFVDNEKVSFRVPYNQATEFIRVWEGDTADPIQDHSLGIIAFSVANQLRAASSVDPTVTVLVMVSFENVVMAVPQPYFPFEMQSEVKSDGSTQLFYWRNEVSLAVSTTPPSLTTNDAQVSEKFTAHGGDIDAPPTTGEQTAEIADPDPIPVDVTAVEAAPRTDRQCRVRVGEKLEYTIQVLPEILRRLHVIPQIDGAPSSYYVQVAQVNSVAPVSGGYRYSIRNMPTDIMQTFYAAWGGSLRYRIYSDGGLKELYYIQTLEKRLGLAGNANAVTYQPSAVDVPELSGETTSFLSTGGTTYYITSNGEPGLTTMKPFEFLFPTGEGNYVDINVPFDTHYYYQCLDLGNYVNLTGPSTGYINVVTNSTRAFVAQALGDDFAYMVFRPPPGLILSGVNYGSAPTADDIGYANIAGFNIKIPST